MLSFSSYLFCFFFSLNDFLLLKLSVKLFMISSPAIELKGKSNLGKIYVERINWVHKTHFEFENQRPGFLCTQLNK